MSCKILDPENCALESMYDKAAREKETMRTELKACLEYVKSIEFVDDNENQSTFCPTCHNWPEHDDNCSTAQRIASLEKLVGQTGNRQKKQYRSKNNE
jgi:hypothetical protein